MSTKPSNTRRRRSQVSPIRTTATPRLTLSSAPPMASTSTSIKKILSFVSVFSSDMLFPTGDAAPTEAQRDGKPVLVMPEQANVLYRLLSIASRIRHFPAHQFIFAIAVLRNIPDVAVKAALCTLKSPMCPENLAFPEMTFLTWHDAQKLYDFHRFCSQAAEEIAEKTNTQEPFPWWERFDYDEAACAPNPNDERYDLYEHCPGQECETLSPPAWFENRIMHLAASLRVLPAASTVEPELLNLPPADAELITFCDQCSWVEMHLAQFSSQLTPYIEESNRNHGAFRICSVPLGYGNRDQDSPTLLPIVRRS
ncbi:hypothetical protein FB451DRAFT_1486371 [Mycena latifolia]|nr:hypothetical protein FB451DRAFT_1486371 [Mycena latifolia]